MKEKVHLTVSGLEQIVSIKGGMNRDREGEKSALFGRVHSEETKTLNSCLKKQEIKTLFLVELFLRKPRS
jgi:hypothetical protein